MLILPIKSRLQILEERNSCEAVWTGKYLILLIIPTPNKSLYNGKNCNAKDFIRFLTVVTKKIHKKAVVRNKFRRRIKEAFSQLNTDLLKNNYDYQIIARHSIFFASVDAIKKDLELCLTGQTIKGFPEKLDGKKKKNKLHLTKTSTVLRSVK